MSSLRWGIVLTVLQYVLACVAGLKTYYFDQLCPNDNTAYTTTVTIGSTWSDYDSSAILKAKKYVTYPTGISCSVTIEPPSGYGVVLAIRSTDLRRNCSVDNLTITDYYGGREQFCGRNYYSQEYRSTFSTKRLSVDFKTGPSSAGSTILKDGFQLTVTTYKSFPCSSFEFECSNLRCIAKELTCDGRNHCGDRSDQSRCGVRSVGGIVGIVFVCVFLMIAAVAGVVYCRSKRNRRITTTTIHNPPPQPPQPMYPPYGTMYPSPGSCAPPPQYSATVQQQEAVNPLYK